MPYTPGPGPTDSVARMVAENLQRRLGQPFIVENRPGASGNISTEYVIAAPADGATVLVGAAGPIAVNPSLFKSLPFDAEKDLAPLAYIGEEMFALVVHPSVNARSLQELLARIKEKPGTFSFSSGGNGAGTHLAGERFRMAAGVDLLHVPYKGGIPALNDVVAGVVPMTFTFVQNAANMAKAGKLNVIAVTGAQRSPLLPDVPTLAEAGLKGAEFTSWYGFIVSGKTPAALAEKMRQAFYAALREPEIRRKVEEQGLRPKEMDAAEFKSFVHKETRRMSEIVRTANITIE
ncbi:tripartite tricarboxylate transporter substrate binding protein [Variovorax sp. WS11]|uniref:Bug family tripartite tricarboxylate transporter substrate binding protein n=1 Tax=Variovorax sp. WS11 TaxID=1105204 RepID=UPI0013DCB530|nr:tripartite tricarboxylate transporter substrate binding protein [Variovorax sp. WS11]NDZ13309.1 tripartite tricarboxylate transporter substrate binding protein [Variovorax sp. WS11]